MMFVTEHKPPIGKRGTDYQLKVSDLMSTDLITLDQDESLDLASEIMTLARIRHLPVVDGERLVGLVTHRDLMRAQVSALAGLSRSETAEIQCSIPVASIMTADVATALRDTSALEAAQRMRDGKFGCLPVLDDRGLLVGILTEADYLDLVIQALERE